MTIQPTVSGFFNTEKYSASPNYTVSDVKNYQQQQLSAKFTTSLLSH